MAISVDTVYRTVLSIANKEQRGFITPDNIAKIGTQVQMSLMDDNLAEYRNLVNDRSNYKFASNYGDLVKLYSEKIDAFLASSDVAVSSGVATMPTSLYKFLNVFSSDRTVKYEEVDRGELNYLLSSPLTAPSTDFPVFYKSNANASVVLSPAPVGGVTIDYLKKPANPRWGYTENPSNGAFVHDGNPYVASGLIVGSLLTNITTNISTATDATYNVDATRSDRLGGTIRLRVTISGGVATTVLVTEAGTGFQGGETLSIPATEFSPSGLTNLNLIITVEESNIYINSTQGSVDFTLHPSDETALVTSILAYMGIVIRDERLTGLASQIAQTKEIKKQS